MIRCLVMCVVLFLCSVKLLLWLKRMVLSMKLVMIMIRMMVSSCFVRLICSDGFKCG